MHLMTCSGMSPFSMPVLRSLKLLVKRSHPDKSCALQQIGEKLMVICCTVKKVQAAWKVGIWSAQGNKFSRKIKFHTCEMLWSFLESTKPDKHHLHPHLRPGERHFAHGYISQIKVFTHLNTNAFQFPIFLVKTETDPDELLPHTQTTRLSHTFTYTLW